MVQKRKRRSGEAKEWDQCCRSRKRARNEDEQSNHELVRQRRKSSAWREHRTPSPVLRYQETSEDDEASSRTPPKPQRCQRRNMKDKTKTESTTIAKITSRPGTLSTSIFCTITFTRILQHGSNIISNAAQAQDFKAQANLRTDIRSSRDDHRRRSRRLR